MNVEKKLHKTYWGGGPVAKLVSGNAWRVKATIKRFFKPDGNPTENFERK